MKDLDSAQLWNKISRTERKIADPDRVAKEACSRLVLLGVIVFTVVGCTTTTGGNDKPSEGTLPAVASPNPFFEKFDAEIKAAAKLCKPAPPAVVTAITKTLKDPTMKLARTTTINAVTKSGVIYVGADVVGADGKVLHNFETWTVNNVAGQTVQSLTGTANKIRTAPDARKTGLTAGDATGIAVQDCVLKSRPAAK